MLSCWLQDGTYASDKVELVLQKQLGDQRIFDYRCDTSCVKVAVTGSLVANSETVIFANYNGDSPPLQECGELLQVTQTSLADELA